MSNKYSQWYKMVGGDMGLLKFGRNWCWYPCLICARYLYPEKFQTPRWQGPPTEAMEKAIKNRIGSLPCGGKETHKKIYKGV